MMDGWAPGSGPGYQTSIPLGASSSSNHTLQSGVQYPGHQTFALPAAPSPSGHPLQQVNTSELQGTDSIHDTSTQCAVIDVVGYPLTSTAQSIPDSSQSIQPSIQG